MAIPLSSNLPWEMANNLWAASINPLLANPFNSIQFVDGVKLVAGVNTIQHRLNRTMLGWFVVDVDGVATIYRSAPMSSVTLTLTSSAAVTVNLGVF